MTTINQKMIKISYFKIKTGESKRKKYREKKKTFKMRKNFPESSIMWAWLKH